MGIDTDSLTYNSRNFLIHTLELEKKWNKIKFKWSWDLVAIVILSKKSDMVKL